MYSYTRFGPKKRTKAIRYYPITKMWSKIRPHLHSPFVQEILVRDFNKFTYGRWKKPFSQGMVPAMFEPRPWWSGCELPKEAWWHYTCTIADDWLLNFNLALATRVAPLERWRIIGCGSSTVWNGFETLFDINRSLYEIPAQAIFEFAGSGLFRLPVRQMYELRFALPEIEGRSC